MRRFYVVLVYNYVIYSDLVEVKNMASKLKVKYLLIVLITI